MFCQNQPVPASGSRHIEYHLFGIPSRQRAGSLQMHDGLGIEFIGIDPIIDFRTLKLNFDSGTEGTIESGLSQP